MRTRLFRVKRFYHLLVFWGWCLMHPLKNQAIATLKEEGLIYERALLTRYNHRYFLIAECEWSSDKKAANMSKWINKIHIFIKKMCLEPTREEFKKTYIKELYKLHV